MRQREGARPSVQPLVLCLTRMTPVFYQPRGLFQPSIILAFPPVLKLSAIYNICQTVCQFSTRATYGYNHILKGDSMGFDPMTYA
jgi:hypothetical protein